MNRARLEKGALALTPVVALATLALGLRSGASSHVRGARVHAAPPGSGRDGVALQIVTLTEQGATTEIAGETELTVVASAHGREARWRGASGSEGLAEAWLDLHDLRSGDAVAVSVTTPEGAVLAKGPVTLPGASPSVGDVSVRPMRKAGSLSIDVFVYGRLIPGVAVPVFVRVRGAPRVGTGGPERVTLSAEPEPGLSVTSPLPSTCTFEPPSNDAWCRISATAEFLTSSWTLTARRASAPTEDGTWYGALPVAPGGATSDLQDRIASRSPHPVHFVVPPATRRLYVEVDDPVGVDFAAALDVASSSRSGDVETVLPALSPGTYWLTTSSSVRETDDAAGSTIARPFRVVSLETPPSMGSTLTDLVTRSPANLPRPLALDGLLAPRRLAAIARRRGLLVAFAALVLGGALETILILQALRRSRTRLDALSEAAVDASGEALPSLVELEGSRALATVVALLFISLLGFAILAGLLTTSTL